MAHSENVPEKDQPQPKASRRKEIRKIRAEINREEKTNRKNQQSQKLTL